MNNVYSGSRAYSDHGPGCSVAGGRKLPRGIQEGLIGCPF